MLKHHFSYHIEKNENGGFGFGFGDRIGSNVNALLSDENAQM